MSSFSKEMICLVLQFLKEEKFNEVVHKLEQQSGIYFNMKYFEEIVIAGDWDEIEKYLSGFTKVDDNEYSTRIFFELRKQKYLEALDGQDRPKALEILCKDLKVFSTIDEDLYKEIALLLTLNNFREHEKLSKYSVAKTARNMLFIELKKLIKVNPIFGDKLVFPTMKSSRLRTLINQSLNWQHHLCENQRPNPDIKTLFYDHTCDHPNGSLAPVGNLPTTSVPRPVAYTPLGGHVPFLRTASNANASGSSSVQAAFVASPSLTIPTNQVAIMKRTITPPATQGMIEYQSAEREPLMKRLRSVQPVEEATYPIVRQQASWSADDLPKTVAFTLNQGSVVTSLDFHPLHPTLLLVGCNNGEITIWEAGIREKLNSKPFKVWDVQSCSLTFQASAANDAPFSVSRVTWSPTGNFCGVAFSKHLIHLYAYDGPNDLCQHLEIDAHVGNVNDVAFALPNKQLCVITCGDDKLIKAWDLTGRILFNFEGHEAPVYSVCPHHKQNIQLLLSTAVDGKIKAWLYGNSGSRADYDSPGRSCTAMLFCADGSRLFSCGTGKDGDSFLVEWNESEGEIKRTYSGLRKKSTGIVQFDTTKNRFLVVGDDNQIKFWDMDNVDLLYSTDAEGDLPSVPRLKFNKEGNLLAVTTAEHGIKILANATGMRSLRIVEAPPSDAVRSPIQAAAAATTLKVPESSAANLIPANCKVEISSPVRPSDIPNGVDSVTRNMESPSSNVENQNQAPDQVPVQLD